MGFPAHSVVQTGYTTPTLSTKPPRGCNVTYICVYLIMCFTCYFYRAISEGICHTIIRNLLLVNKMHFLLFHLL